MKIPSVGFNQDKSNQAELEVIELSSLYDGKVLGHDPETAHRVSFFILIYFEQGEGMHMVDFKDYPFAAGSMIFVQREQVHAFSFKSKPTGKVLLFTQAFLDNVHTNMRLPNYTPSHLNQKHTPLLNLDITNNKRTQTLIDEMMTEFSLKHSDPLLIMYLFSALALLLHRLRPEVRHDKLSTQQSAKFAQFFKLMQTNFQLIRDANWYAKQINSTYKTLNHICKLATGLTAKQMIDAFTLLEMKRCLIITNVTTQQMAYDFGFEDISNFVKYFKNQTKLTPTQFQKRFLTPSL